MADRISRIIEFDDWRLNPDVFRQLDIMWGPHQVDRFADENNAQVPVFNSRFWGPGTSGIDAFCYDWSGVLNWCCPPVCLICRLLKHTRACGAQGTLIVPHWPSAVFWPIICPQAGRFASFIKSVFELPQVEGITLAGKRGHNLVDGKPKFKLLALRFCF